MLDLLVSRWCKRRVERSESRRSATAESVFIVGHRDRGRIVQLT